MIMEKRLNIVILSFFLLISVSRLVFSVDSEYSAQLPLNTENNSAACPPWTTIASDNSCQCGFKEDSAVNCINDNLTVTFPLTYCISYNELFNTTIVGYCILTKHDYRGITTAFSSNFSSSNGNVSQLNDDFCKDLHMNRTGQLCGRCKDGFAPPVYSYSLACVNCTDYKYNWIKYIAVAYLPLTVFYVLVIVFRISSTSGSMNGFIITSQVAVSPLLLRLVAVTQFEEQFDSIVAKTLVSFYGVWNLDFFRSLYTPFCIHPNISHLQVLALDYAVAVYPLMLVVITYIFASLHYRYPRVVSLWRPFNRCFRCIRREWDIRDSLIAAFALFILLCYVKILVTSLDLLTPVTIFDMNNKRLPQRYLRVDGTVKYFGTQHLPYAILAMLMLLVFNLIPLLLLCLYPCRCFHKCLNYCKLQSLLLNSFMDIIHGPFKIHPHDCRYFPAIYLSFQIVNLLIYSVTNGFLYFTFAGISSMTVTLIIAVGRPYRVPFYNTVDMVFFSILTLAAYEYPCHVFQQIFGGNDYNVAYTVWVIFYGVLFTVPALYGTCVVAYAITPRRKMAVFLLMVSSNVQKWFKSNRENTDNGIDTSEAPRPHRLEHSEEYPPLVDMERVSNYQACQNITIDTVR